MNSIATTATSMRTLILKVSEELEKVPKFELREYDKDLFEDCYKRFHQYLVDTGTYCIKYEAIFCFLKEVGPQMTTEQIENFLWNNGRLPEMTKNIVDLSATGLSICSTFNELKNNLKNDSFYECSKWTNLVKILAGAIALIVGVAAIVYPALWFVDPVIIGAFSGCGVTVGTIGVTAVVRGSMKEVSDSTLSKLHDFVENMSNNAHNLTTLTNTLSRKVQVFEIAFGQQHISPNMISEMCDSFEALRRSVEVALGGKSDYCSSTMISFAAGVGVGGAAMAMTSQSVSENPSSSCSIM